MRLAEFKTRLFIFCAGRLLKWAESIEREIRGGQSPPATAVDDSNAVLFDESSRVGEAASGPPEQWARLVTSGPPQHWLDLVRQKAPHLLQPTRKEPLSPQADSESAGREYLENETNDKVAGSRAGENAAVQGSQDVSILQPGKTRYDTKRTSTEPGRTTWLNRLRFHPRVRPVENLPPTYVADPRKRKLDPSPAEGGASAGRSELTSRHPTLSSGKSRGQSQASGLEKNLATNKTIARPSRRLKNTATRNAQPVNDESVNDRHIDREAGTRYPEWQHVHRVPEVQESSFSKSASQATSKRTAPVTASDTIYPARLNTPPERVRTAETDSHAQPRTASGRDTYAESPPRKTNVRSEGSDRTRGATFDQRETGHPSGRVFRQLNLEDAPLEFNPARSWIQKGTTKLRTSQPNRKRIAADDGSSAPIPPAVANKRLSRQPIFLRRSNVVNSDEPTRKDFASTDLTVPTPIETRIESNENVWPSLPPAPKFEVADELAAMEQEAEALRRLEQEQRGTLWNA